MKEKIASIYAQQRALETRVAKYGRGGERAALFNVDGSCWEWKDAEYIYELCGLDEVKQKKLGDAKNSKGTSLGKFKAVEGSKVYFEGGDKCHGRPDRRAVVEVKCGSEGIVEVEETETCVYKVVIENGAGCEEGGGVVGREINFVR